MLRHVASLESSLQVRDEELIAERAKTSELVLARTDAEDSLRRLRAEKQEIQSQQTELVGQLSALTAEQALAQNKLEQTELALDRSEAQLAAVTGDKSVLEAQLADTVEKSIRLAEELEVVGSREQGMQGQLDGARSRIATLERALRDYDRSVRERNIARDDLAAQRLLVATLQESIERVESEKNVIDRTLEAERHRSAPKPLNRSSNCGMTKISRIAVTMTATTNTAMG